MSSLQPLRKFISDRLSAAAEEICRHFEETIVRYEAELDRQRALLSVSGKEPQILLYNIGLPQHLLNRSGDLCDQQTNSNLKKDGPEPPPMKEEQREVCITQNQEQVVLKLEAETFVLIPNLAENEPGHETTSQRLETSACQDQAQSHQEKSTTTSAEARPHEHDRLNLETSAKCLEPETNTQTSNENKQTDKTTSRNVKGEDLNNSLESNLPLPKAPSTERSKASLKKELEKYTRARTGEKPCTCEKCGKVFHHTSNLRKHLKVHSGEKPHCCEYCGKRWNRKFDLTQHLRIHTGEKPFSCKFCGKGFTINSNLKIHIRKHTGEKPFVCGECGESFRLGLTLTNHKATHTEDKPFTCLECGKQFSRRFHLKPHMRSHMREQSCSSENATTKEQTPPASQPRGVTG